MTLFDVNLESNINNNYDVLRDLIYALKQKHFPKTKTKNNSTHPNAMVRHG